MTLAIPIEKRLEREIACVLEIMGHVRDRLEGLNEADIKAAFIAPILSALGRELRGPPATPLPEGIKSARVAAGFTQTQAAAIVHSSRRRWQEWEAGQHRMHPGLWELFALKTARN